MSGVTSKEWILHLVREEKIGVNGSGNEISLLTNYLCI